MSSELSTKLALKAHSPQPLKKGLSSFVVEMSGLEPPTPRLTLRFAPFSLSLGHSGNPL